MQASNDGPVQSVWKFFLASVQSAKLIVVFFKNNVEGMYSASARRARFSDALGLSTE